MNINIFWFRRDLRIDDNHGLYEALISGSPVLPLFIFDPSILDDLDDKYDRRVNYIYYALRQLEEKIQKYGSSLEIRIGLPIEIFKQLAEEYEIDTVFVNEDYEPYAIYRDKEVMRILKERGITFKSYKDQVVFEKNEVVKDNGHPYHIFTPYSRKWLSLIQKEYVESFPVKKHLNNFLIRELKPFPSLREIGFFYNNDFPKSFAVSENILINYHKTRNNPSIKISCIGIHLRFGTVSIRQLVKKAMLLNKTYLNELIWREFFMHLLWHYPGLVTSCFKPEYESIKWRNNTGEFDKWCKGETGYPLVDAGMRELNKTGYMHNRVRMIAASFLVKHLLTDWRKGEAFFAQKLLDYELASNNGNWQWVAGCGCDAAPYFRMFNPQIQAIKFDPELQYIKKWVPEYGTESYPLPIVEHKTARERFLMVYKSALQSSSKK